jgi:hypothetical protein
LRRFPIALYAARRRHLPPAQPTVIPIEVSFDNHVFVKVCAGDLPLDFILDTGASMNFFDLRTAERLGLKLGDSMIGTGAGPGSIAGAWLEGASVRFPGSSLTQSVSGALDFSRMGRGSGRRVGGCWATSSSGDSSWRSTT